MTVVLTGVRRHLAAIALALVPVVVVGGGLWLDERENRWDGRWELVSAEYDGTVLTLPSRPITLDIPASLSSRAVCNFYGFRVEPGWRSDSFEFGSTTFALCGPPSAARLERTYYAALDRIEAGDRDGDTLTLTGPRTRLVYERTG